MTDKIKDTTEIGDFLWRNTENKQGVVWSPSKNGKLTVVFNKWEESKDNDR